MYGDPHEYRPPLWKRAGIVILTVVGVLAVVILLASGIAWVGSVLP